MAITQTIGGTIFTGNGVTLFHLRAQLSACQLELKGLKHSRGSVIRFVKNTHGFKGSKASVVEQFTAYVDARAAEILANPTN